MIGAAVGETLKKKDQHELSAQLEVCVYTYCRFSSNFDIVPFRLSHLDHTACIEFYVNKVETYP